MFSILMNQDYWGLSAEVGIRNTNGVWTMHPMTYAGRADGNSIWTWKPTAAFAEGAGYQYFFHGKDTAGSHIWDSRNGQNYDLRFAPSYSAPTWMGVYGGLQRHDAGNPGAFHVYVNRERYEGLNCGIGFRIDAGSWAYQPMSFVTNFEGNSRWRWQPAGAFPAGSRVEYYFHAWDTRGARLWDSNQSANYSFTNPVDSATWMGVYGQHTRHTSGNPGTFQILVNRHRYPGLNVGMGYSDNDGLTWTFEPMTFRTNVEVNSLWTFTPPEPFVNGTTIAYFFHAWDAQGTSLWDSRDGQNHRADFYTPPSNIFSSVRDHDLLRAGVLTVYVEVEQPYYPGLRAGVGIRMEDQSWQVITLTNYFSDLGWTSFYGDLTSFPGSCSTTLHYYGFADDNRGMRLFDGDPSSYRTTHLPVFQYNPVDLSSRTNTYTRSRAFALPTSRNAVRYAFSEAGLANAPWQTPERYLFMELPEGTGWHEVFIDSQSFLGCTMRMSKRIYCSGSLPDFLPPQDMGSRIRHELLPLIPTNAQPSDKLIFQQYSAHGPVVWSTNWLAHFDFTGVAWDVTQCGTLIDSNIMVNAWHYQRPLGDRVVFHDRAGALHQRTIVEKTTGDSYGRDYAFYRLDSPLPGTIKTYKFLHPTYRYMTTLTNALAISTDGERKAHLRRILALGQGAAFEQDPAISTNLYEGLVSGDSGNPAFLYVDGELVLLATWTTGGPGSGPFYSSPDQLPFVIPLLGALQGAPSMPFVDLTEWAARDDLAWRKTSAPYAP